MNDLSGKNVSSMRILFAITLSLISYNLPAQELETETTRLLPKGWLKLGAAYEYQTSSQGKELAIPFILEYGISNRLEITAEPIVFSSIKPDNAKTTNGIGDLELTLTYLLLKEKTIMPALAVGGEIKFPTAKNDQIGTGKTDYGLYLIGSKKSGDLDLNANLNYTYVGKVPGANLQDIFFFAAAFTYNIKDKYLLFGEVFGNTSSTDVPENFGINTGILVPEAAGNELVGTLDLGYYLIPNLLLSFSTSYDNNNALLFRPAISIETNLLGRHDIKKKISRDMAQHYEFLKTGIEKFHFNLTHIFN
ncbi:MAG: transporter [bacterium]